MRSADIRESFLSFFESRGHTRVPSSSLYLTDDPTLLFPNAGMNQFKNCFLGVDRRDYVRAVSSQKCMRISGKHNDFENVGISPSHHTFFEMLGNFSFGDYFKSDAISFAWEFLTEVLKLPVERLWVTVHESDSEAEDLWQSVAGVPRSKIVRLGDAENFWSMGETGPCGPCSEIHYFMSGDPSSATAADLEQDTGRFTEIWNLVFMQYNRQEDGTLDPLPSPSVDTGMGLERMAAVLQGVASNYDTDLLRPVIDCCEQLSGKKYSGESFERRDLLADTQYASDVAMRVIADHSRALAFLIADGILPASDGRGYVLRRILRRAVRHGRALNFKEPFLQYTTATVVDFLGGVYPELVESKETIRKIVHAEEVKFYETLDSGLAVLEKEVARVPAGQLFPGETAFLLHDTYGFPLDLTEDALKAYKIKVDIDGFTAAMEQQKSRSREDRRSRVATASVILDSKEQSSFAGYELTELESEILEVKREGDSTVVLTRETPFYAESGGQVGDTGVLEIEGKQLPVVDTQKLQTGQIVHICEGSVASSGALKGCGVKLKVDAERRNRIARNHSATHLVHSALREFLGDHVKQAGSRVDENSLRFDYSHFSPLEPAQLRDIQAFVNEEVRSNHLVSTEVVPLKEAKSRGATALFGEKYGENVRMVQIGAKSLELCGGTHVNRSGDIGFVMIGPDGGISSGVRRIECYSGQAAEAQLAELLDAQERLAAILKTNPASLEQKAVKLVDQAALLEREIRDLKSKQNLESSDDLVAQIKTTKGGIKVISSSIDNIDTDGLRDLVDRLKLKIGSGVVVLGGSCEGKTTLVAGVTKDLTANLHAGKLIQEAAKVSGGKGGGRPDFAQAGGSDPAKLQLSLDKFFELIA